MARFYCRKCIDYFDSPYAAIHPICPGCKTIAFSNDDFEDVVMSAFRELRSSIMDLKKDFDKFKTWNRWS
jgi:hypothetical protein